MSPDRLRLKNPILYCMLMVRSTKSNPYCYKMSVPSVKYFIHYLWYLLDFYCVRLAPVLS